MLGLEISCAFSVMAVYGFIPVILSLVYYICYLCECLRCDAIIFLVGQQLVVIAFWLLSFVDELRTKDGYKSKFKFCRSS